MNFLYYVIYEVYYECINRNILDSNVMNMYIIISTGNYGAVDARNTSCQDYCIIRFSSSPYTLQE